MANIRTGAYGNSLPPTAEVQLLVNQVEDRVNQGNLVATVYRSQVVAGTNYLVKVYHPGDNSYLHLNIFQPLPPKNDAQLMGNQPNHAWNDPLEPFN